MLAPSIPMDTDDSGFDCLSTPSPVYGQLILPNADRLTSSEIGTLAKGRCGTLGGTC